jgi:hypothetical protein
MGDEIKIEADSDDEATLAAEAAELYRKLATALLPLAPIAATEPEIAVLTTKADGGFTEIIG